MGKKWIALLLAGVLAVGLCGCWKRTPEPEQSPAQIGEQDVLEVYQRALTRLLVEHIDLDGYEYSPEQWKDTGRIDFAIHDVDGDEVRELILQFSDMSINMYHTNVYRYDAEKDILIEEFEGTAPNCYFYDNGAVRWNALRQSNGLAGRIWPYTVSKYDEETGVYQDIASVDGYDLELMESQGAQGLYPTEIDTEGAGFVYFIDHGEEKTTMSQSEYEAWYDSIFEGAREIQLLYWPLTEENIADLENLKTPQEKWEAELARCVVSGNETDYEVIAAKLTEQYAEVVRERPRDQEESALDAQPMERGKAVYDIYYGEDNPNFAFIIGLYLDVEPEKVDNWHVGTFLEEPNPYSSYPTYWGWSREATAAKGEDGNWHLTDMGTGGYAAQLPFRHGHPEDHPGFEELMDAWFVTEGFSHNYLIPYNLDCEGYSAADVLAEVNKRPAEERPELIGDLWAYVKEYGELREGCSWKANDFIQEEQRVNININDGWIDEGLWNELAKGQKELLNDLPVDELPREAVPEEMGRGTRGDMWRDTLLPMCYDEKNDVTLYAVASEDSEDRDDQWVDAGVVLRVGDQAKYYPIAHCQWWVGSNPLMVIQDLDDDGADEAAVSFFCGHGTGVSVSMLYIFDLETLEYETVDCSELNIPVGIYRDEMQGKEFATLSVGESNVTLEATDLPRGWEKNGVVAQNIVRYELQNGCLWGVLGLDFGGRTLNYLAEIRGQLYYDNGKYTLDSLQVEAY